MAFASPSSTIPIQSNLCLEAGQQRNPTLTRYLEQHDDNSPLPQSSSFQNVYGITEVDTNLDLGFPSSWSITPNVGHHSRCLSDDVENSEPYPSSAPSSSSPVGEHQSHRPNSPPLTDDNFITSITTSKNETSSSHSKNNHHHHHHPHHHHMVALFPSILLALNHRRHLNPGIILQNSGSVARDHLASERTFLAYVHTSLALASTGVGVVQLFTIADLILPNSSDILMMEKSRRMQRFAVPLGVLTQVLALYILFLGECVCVLWRGGGFFSLLFLSVSLYDEADSKK